MTFYEVPATKAALARRGRVYVEAKTKEIRKLKNKFPDLKRTQA